MSEYLMPTRAEEISNDFYNYFVKPSESFYRKLLINKATVLVGGRGTGKTMLLKSLALEYKKQRSDYFTSFVNEKYIGCYIRADIKIVNNFSGRGISDDEWDAIFAHYFNLITTQQIFFAIRTISQKIDLNEKCLGDIVDRYIAITNDNDIEKTIDGVLKSIIKALDRLVMFMNNPKVVSAPILINNGYLFTSICETLSQHKEFDKKTWFIMVDEYENLPIGKQKIINTLIKANQPPVIFKIAMKPGGWWTRETAASTESLDISADYELIDYQSDVTDKEFVDLAVEISKNNLAKNGITDENYLDVRNLLVELSPEDEALDIYKKSKRKPEFENRVIKIVESFTEDMVDRSKYISALIIKEEPLRTRLHLVLLEKEKEKYTPEDIYIEKTGNTDKYKEWYKHYRIGTLYLFCSEYGVRKKYTGFDTFIDLSSKIMRSYICILSKTLEFSQDNGFTAEAPKPFDFNDQNKAVYNISQKKVFEIETYASLGPMLYSFANYLGRIFEKLNKDTQQKQPERNHFSIVGSVDSDTSKYLSGALLYSVLQEDPANKLRSGEIRDKDYLLNRIYSPYYNISYRKMHKLDLAVEDLRTLFSANDEEKKSTLSRLTKALLKDDISSHGQTSFFGLGGV